MRSEADGANGPHDDAGGRGTLRPWTTPRVILSEVSRSQVGGPSGAPSDHTPITSYQS